MPSRGPPNSHSLADHAMGALAADEHGEGEFDHDHDSDFDSPSRSLESVEFLSMGLDIGSSSAQVAFSRLSMRGPGEHRALRARLRECETLYVSPIAPTPFAPDGTIDEPRLRALIDRSFAAANLTPDDIETGAAILTGEAATRANAAAIAQAVAEDVGELVCAAAGHHMEAMLAARGSGAVEASRAGAGRRILLIDVGGATTKFAIVADGDVVVTAAIAVGGRLLTIDKSNRIARLDSAGAHWSARAGKSWKQGDVIAPGERADVAAIMADAIVAAAKPNVPAGVGAFFLTEPLGEPGAIDGLMVSGGVGEYVYGRETRDFGDLGRALGLALRARIDRGAFMCPLLPPGECIRATVLGASGHSVQLSGDTIYISAHAALLPRRNLPVLRPRFEASGDIDPARVGAAIADHRAAFDRLDAREPFALSLPWRGEPGYARVRALAEGVALGLADMIAARTPLYLIVEGDLALTLGAILKSEMAIPSEVLAIDGVATRDFDFIDIGRLRLPSHTVPATIKSLLFSGTPARSG